MLARPSIHHTDATDVHFELALTQLTDVVSTVVVPTYGYLKKIKKFSFRTKKTK